VRPEELREFAARSRANVAAAKRQHWRSVVQTGDGLAAFDAGQALYEHARAVSNFPDAGYLAADLAHQVRLKQLLDRASQAIALRRAPR
jgi:hypothetical protein